MSLATAAPRGYHNVLAYLIVEDAARAIDFYTSIFGATERTRMPGPNGRILHAELDFGDSCVMLADQNPAMDAWAPGHFGGSPVTLMLYVSDVDETYRRAITAGGRSRREPADQFYGDRTAGVDDPFGHRWYLATHIRDVSPEEMQSAMANA